MCDFRGAAVLCVCREGAGGGGGSAYIIMCVGADGVRGGLQVYEGL